MRNVIKMSSLFGSGEYSLVEVLNQEYWSVIISNTVAKDIGKIPYDEIFTTEIEGVDLTPGRKSKKVSVRILYCHGKYQVLFRYAVHFFNPTFFL